MPAGAPWARSLCRHQPASLLSAALHPSTPLPMHDHPSTCCGLGTAVSTATLLLSGTPAGDHCISLWEHRVGTAEASEDSTRHMPACWLEAEDAVRGLHGQGQEVMNQGESWNRLSAKAEPAPFEALAEADYKLLGESPGRSVWLGAEKPSLAAGLPRPSARQQECCATFMRMDLPLGNLAPPWEL